MARPHVQLFLLITSLYIPVCADKTYVRRGIKTWAVAQLRGDITPESGAIIACFSGTISSLSATNPVLLSVFCVSNLICKFYRSRQFRNGLGETVGYRSKLPCRAGFILQIINSHQGKNRMGSALGKEKAEISKR